MQLPYINQRGVLKNRNSDKFKHLHVEPLWKHRIRIKATVLSNLNQQYQDDFIYYRQ